MIKLAFSAFIAATFLFAASAFAATHWHASTIKSVYPHGNGTIVLVLNTDAASCTTTTPGVEKQHHLVVGQNGVTAEGLKHLYAAALLAKATGASVTLVYSDEPDYCYVSRIRVNE